MNIRTPSTSAERALEEHALVRRARVEGRPPARVSEISHGEQRVRFEGPAPLLLNHTLPAGHPLEDTPADIRRKRVAEERRKRGLL